MYPLFFKSLCATFYQQLSIFRMTCIKYVPTKFWGKCMCAPNFLVCAHLTTCARAHVHRLEGTLMCGDLVVSVVGWKSRGSGFKFRPGQKFGSRFLLHLCSKPTQLWRVHSPYTVIGKMRWWRRGLATCPHMPRLRKSLTLHTQTCCNAVWLDQGTDLLIMQQKQHCQCIAKHSNWHKKGIWNNSPSLTNVHIYTLCIVS